MKLDCRHSFPSLVAPACVFAAVVALSARAASAANTPATPTSSSPSTQPASRPATRPSSRLADLSIEELMTIDVLTGCRQSSYLGGAAHLYVIYTGTPATPAIGASPAPTRAKPDVAIPSTGEALQRDFSADLEYLHDAHLPSFFNVLMDSGRCVAPPFILGTLNGTL